MQNVMKIIINAYQYAPSITGTDRMAHNFLAELQKLDTENKYYILCSAEDYIPKNITASNFKVLRPLNLYGFAFMQRVVNKLWRTFLPFFVWPLRADVYFSFHNMRLPHMRVAKRMIASNLDLIPLQVEGYENLDPKMIVEIKYTARKADRFMSISNFSKQQLCNLLGVPNKKIEVISLAPDPQFADQTKQNHSRSNAAPTKFILTIGGSEPRKNVKTVVDAFVRLPPELQSKHPLVIVGGDWQGLPLESLQINKNIKTLGYVSDDDLARLYKRAAVFVFASKYEGFGFTILEAMASGAPVITSNSSSLPEVAENAALSFNPDSTVDLLDKLKRLITNPDLRRKVAMAGIEQSKKFSWHKAARQLQKLLIDQ